MRKVKLCDVNTHGFRICSEGFISIVCICPIFVCHFVVFFLLFSDVYWFLGSPWFFLIFPPSPSSPHCSLALAGPPQFSRKAFPCSYGASLILLGPLSIHGSSYTLPLETVGAERPRDSRWPWPLGGGHAQAPYLAVP